MRKTMLVLTALAVFAAHIMPLIAQESGDAKGKSLFKKSCRVCHSPGGAAAKEITPLSKTQAQWKAYFAAGKHMAGSEQLDTLLKPDQLKDVQTYLVNHASDSPQPEAGD